jgi:NADH:ubiquinone oxidoreductase subunit 6 (subunit J)
MSVEQVVFYIIAAVAVAGALGVVLSRDIVHSALFLVVVLVMTAGVFVLLSSEFLALVQILVYGGGITILVVFALMMTQLRQARGALDGPQKPFAALLSLALIGVLGVMVFETDWIGETDRISVIDTRALGTVLFRDFAVPFEIASFVLLAALIGAVVLARTDDEGGAA